MIKPWSMKTLLLLLCFPCNIVTLLGTENSTALKTPLCSDQQEIQEWRLPDILCGCFQVVVRQTDNGFVLLALLQKVFWKSLSLLLAVSARFDVYLKHNNKQIPMGEIICAENATVCEKYFEANGLNNSQVQIFQVYLSCDSKHKWIPSPCEDCSYIKLFYTPRIDSPISYIHPSGRENVSTERSTPSTRVLYFIIPVVIVICAVVTFIVFFVHKRRSRTSEGRTSESYSSEPLVSVIETSTPQSKKEILIIDIAPNESCSVHFRNILKSVPKFSVVCFIDHLKDVNQNMYDWAHKKLKTCDFIVIVFTSELTRVFESDSCEILQSSPYSDIVKYLLSQMNSNMYTNDASSPEYTGVQFEANVVVPSSFSRHLANISFKNIFTFPNLLQKENSTRSQLNRLLMKIGADNEDIKHCIST
ncbi:uncharacterized protein LOC133188086 [Saccostrea echinata]|uniref:uncharacterized protein LOC133188086 n=1 Tax=Saccostrea echinata TaxID=191078 RepID=UPI002A83F486|nr:uncharacterized protein LOC133188086 [Saccostrea echinata]